jgi:hypothetical protein
MEIGMEIGIKTTNLSKNNAIALLVSSLEKYKIPNDWVGPMYGQLIK